MRMMDDKNMNIEASSEPVFSESRQFNIVDGCFSHWFDWEQEMMENSVEIVSQPVVKYAEKEKARS